MANMNNFRSMVLEAGLNAVLERKPRGSLNAFEVGCMFSLDEGLSTYLVPRTLAKAGRLNRFFSVELVPFHIKKAKQILTEEDESLLHRVEFREGMSLDVLPGILEEIGSFSFAFLDGGADPDICLREFELAAAHMTPGGILVLDDLQEIPPAESFSKTRPLGKGTLVLPYLVMADYLLNPRDGERNEYFSHILNAMCPHFPLELVVGLDYRIISDGRHKMLVVGDPEVIRVFQQKLLVERVEESLLSGESEAGPVDYYRLEVPFGLFTELKEIPLKKVFEENRAKIYFQLGQQAESLGLDSWKRYFERSLEILSKRTDASELERYWQASLYRKLGDISRSRERFGQLLGAAGKGVLPGIYYHLGEIAFLEGKIGESRDYFQKCLALSPRHKKALKFLLRREFL